MFNFLFRHYTRWRVSRAVKKGRAIEMPPELIPLTQAASVLIAYCHYKQTGFDNLAISKHFERLQALMEQPGAVHFPPLLSQLMIRIGSNPENAVLETYSALVVCGDAVAEELPAFVDFFATFENKNEIGLKV